MRFTFKNGAWDEGELVKDPYVKVHIANTALHYGQSVFEGLKAFHGKDGRCSPVLLVLVLVLVFRCVDHHRRARSPLVFSRPQETAPLCMYPKRALDQLDAI